MPSDKAGAVTVMVSFFLERDVGGLGTKTFLYRKPYKTQTSSAQNLKSSNKKEKKQKRKCSVKKKFDEPSTGWGGGASRGQSLVAPPSLRPHGQDVAFGLQTSRGRSFLSEGFTDQSDCVFGDKRLKPAAEDEAILSSVSLKGPGTELLRYAHYQLADENQSRSSISAAS